MRKVIALLVLGILAASSASAATFWTESFGYSDGGLVAVSGGNWVNHSGTGTDIQVVGGEAVCNSATTPDDNRSFTAQDASAKTYYCFKLKATGTPTTTGAYFIHLKDTGTMNFAARVWIRNVDTNTYNIGISATGNTVTWWSTALTKGAYYNISAMYDAAAGSASLWVGATDESSVPITATGGTTGLLMSAVGLRQATGYGVATVDEITVGTSLCAPGVVSTTNDSWSGVKGMYK